MMKVGDLVRCPPVNSKWDAEREWGVFVGHEKSIFDDGTNTHSYVWAKGKKLVFLTRELEVVNESR
tara:strand:+ start:666 stop:863 length:198 start_codon:yes stop_codon:yes gene_type:complete